MKEALNRRLGEIDLSAPVDVAHPVTARCVYPKSGALVAPDSLWKIVSVRMRSSVERGLPRPEGPMVQNGESTGSLPAVCGRLADLLDRSVTGSNSRAVSQAIDALTAEWVSAGGAAEGASILQRGRGLVGMMNVTPPSDPLYPHASNQLVEFKQALRARAAGR